MMVEVSDTLEDLLHDVTGIQLVVVNLFDEAIKELTTSAKVGDDKDTFLGLVEIPHFDDVGMVYLCENGDFFLEHFFVAVLEGLFGDDLECTLLAGGFVYDGFDDSKGALAKDLWEDIVLFRELDREEGSTIFLCFLEPGTESMVEMRADHSDLLALGRFGTMKRTGCKSSGLNTVVDYSRLGDAGW